MSEVVPLRAVQYLGNKSRIVGDITRAVSQVRDPSRPVVCDLFSGTGVVSGALGREFPTLGVDIQEYSRVLTSAQLKPAKIETDHFVEVLNFEMKKWMNSPVGELIAAEARLLEDALGGREALVSLTESGSLEASSQWERVHPLGEVARDALAWARAVGASTLFRYYGGVFFSYRQALEIDTLAAIAERAVPDSRDTAVAAVLGSASSLVSSVGGHFAQPVALRDRMGHPKLQAIERVRSKRRELAAVQFPKWADRYAYTRPAVEGSRAVRSEVGDFVYDLPASVGCVYADPPYTREHYSRFYHVLETIARGEQEPGITPTTRGDGTAPSRGLYAKDRYQSPFSIVQEAPIALGTLACAIADRGVPLVLSYSPVPDTDKPRQRVMALDLVAEILREHFNAVAIRPVGGIRHARLNSSRVSASPITEAEEVLILATHAR